MLLLFLVPSLPQPTPGLAEVLAAAEKAEPHQALLHLKTVWQRWDETPMSLKDRRELALKWVDLLGKNARTTEDVLLVVGTLKPRLTQRQVLYQRYVEQSRFESRIGFLLETERRKGQEGRVRRIWSLDP